MFLFLCINFWLRLVNSCSCYAVVIVAAELAIPTGIPVKEAKVKMETHPATLEAKLSKSLA